MAGAVLVSAWALGACRAAPTPSGEVAVVESTPAPAPGPPLVHAYPPGRWRLAPPQALTDVMIGTSHILIRHGGSDAQVPGSVAPWRLEPPPRRSRAEALALAAELSRQLAADPSRFEALARQHSEDRTTALAGGHQGAGRATDFWQEPAVLDALAALRPGEVSRVIETSHGFQIVRREPLPPPATVGGRHIVLGHGDSRWLELVGAAAPPRSHAEALELASAVWREAAAHPERFGDLIERYSEHPDKVNGGDLGTWSVREPTHYPRAVRALLALAPGAVHPPIESHVGFEIIQRTQARPRATYAMEAIKLSFEPADAASRQRALAEANALLALLAREPARFDELRRERCCDGWERWVEGREEPGLTPVVAELAVGAIATRPALQYLNVVIPRRIDPGALPPAPEVRYELPSPEQPPILWGLAQLSSASIARELDAVSRESQAALGLSAAELAGVRRVGSELDDERRDDRDLLRRFEALLGSERAQRFFRAIEQRLARSMLETSQR